MLRSYLAVVLDNPEWLVRRATNDMTKKFPPREMALPGSAVTVVNDVVPSFMERILATGIVQRLKKGLVGTVVERHSEDTEQKGQSPSKSIMKLMSNTTSEIVQVLAEVTIVTEAKNQCTVETRMTRWKRTFQLHIAKAFDTPLEDSLQLGSFNSNNIPKAQCLTWSNKHWLKSFV